MKMFMNHTKVSLGSAIVSSLAVMMCCWVPALLAGLAGITTMASYFSWVHPLRHYFFGIAFLSIGYSFYMVYSPSKQGKDTEIEECCETAECETTKSEATEKSFLKSKWFVWLIALFVAIVFAIEYFPNLILG